MNPEENQTHKTAVEYIRKNQNTGNDLCREDEFIAALLEVVDAQAVDIKIYKELYEATQRGQLTLQEKVNSQALELEKLKKEIKQYIYSLSTTGSYSEKMHDKYGDKSGWT